MSISPLNRKISRRAIRSLLQQSLETLEPRVLLAGNSYAIFVYSFTGGADGAQPFAGLVADTQGDLFGTTGGGGTGGDGAVFELPAVSGTAVPLYNFTGSPNGAAPYSGLTIDNTGDLFGTTFAGGASGDGTVFEIPAGSTTPTILYSFSGLDGANPYGTLLVDSAGDLFGTTVNGGQHGDGTIFEIPFGGTLATLHSFAGKPSDGASPFSPLAIDGAGDLFGTTDAGGTNGDGTVFEISAGGAYAVLHSFTGADGSKPTGQLIVDDAGDIFGTTSTGGADGDGTIFNIPANSALISLYSFTGGVDGATPFAGLTLDNAGDFLGTTLSGGAHGDGTVFEVPFGDLAGNLQPQTLYTFTGGGDGAAPYGPITLGAAGDLFGTASTGGADAHGVIFELSPTLTTQMTVTKQPGDIQAGLIMPPVVVHLNLANTDLNLNDTSGVTLSIVSGPAGGTIGGTTTVRAIGGVATFSNLKFTHAGNYTLVATDGTLDPVVLDDFVVNSGPPARLAYTLPPTGIVAGQTMTQVTVDVEDSLGNITTDNSMVTLKLISVPPGATLNGALTEQAVNGVATFSDLSLTKAGSYTISASDGKLTVAKSAAFVVTPDTTSAQLVFARIPATSIVAKPFAAGLLVEVEDQFGNLINTANALPVTVSLTGSNATAATLTGTTSMHLVKGVATFANLAISQPGSFQLQASGAGLAPITSANPVQNIFVPTHLVFNQQPMQITAGGTISQVVVWVEDAFDRRDTTNNSMVTISLKGSGTLTGTLSLQAVNGIATFSDLSLTKAGSFSLAAASGTLTLGKSASFNVIPDVSSSQLVVVTPPASPLVVGKTLAPNLVVDVEDQFGNIITTDHSSATLSIVGGPSESTITGITTINDVNGVFTFKNLSLPLVGAYSLQVTNASLSIHTLSSPIAETITQGVTSIGSLPNSTHTFGQTIGVSATFKSPTTIPFTGIATLTDSQSDVLGTVTLTSSGMAKFSLAGIVPGSYVCSVNYPGDVDHTAATSSTFTLLINQAATTTTLTTSSSSLVFGQPLTLTATVKSTNAPNVARTGEVEFFDGLTMLEAVPLDGNSIATLTLTPATLGSHSFKAIYVGDTNFKTSTSPAAARTVNKDKASITLTSTLPSPIPDNQTFNLNIHVSIVAPGTSNLTGILVTIKDNGKTLGTANLDSNGDAILPALSFSAPGMQTLTAVYAGDADTLTTTSAALKLTIT